METTSVLPPKHDHDFHLENSEGERRTEQPELFGGIGLSSVPGQRIRMGEALFRASLSRLCP